VTDFTVVLRRKGSLLSAARRVVLGTERHFLAAQQTVAFEGRSAQEPKTHYLTFLTQSCVRPSNVGPSQHVGTAGITEVDGVALC
jgi:hypothetical protein